MTKKYDLYGVGSALVDTEISIPPGVLKQIGAAKGTMTLIDEQEQQRLLKELDGSCTVAGHSCGGSAANTVISHSYFGGRSFFSCCTSADEDGNLYRNELRKAGVESNYSQIETGITGKCLVMITPDAERTMFTHLGVSAEISPTDIDTSALKDSRWLYLESYLVATPKGLETALTARRLAAEHGVPTALSFSDPSIVLGCREQLQQLIGDGVELIFCNADEAMGWCGKTALADCLAPMRRVSRHTVLTMGGDGAQIITPDQLLPIPPVRTDVVDTNGAGDMFAGAFMYGLIGEFPLDSVGRFAAFAASDLVSRFGPRLLPDRHRQLLAEFHASGGETTSSVSNNTAAESPKS